LEGEKRSANHCLRFLLAGGERVQRAESSIAKLKNQRKRNATERIRESAGMFESRTDGKALRALQGKFGSITIRASGGGTEQNTLSDHKGEGGKGWEISGD